MASQLRPVEVAMLPFFLTRFRRSEEAGPQLRDPR